MNTQPHNPIDLEHAAGERDRYVYVPEPIIRCPKEECMSENSKANGTKWTKDDEGNRLNRYQYRICRDCGHIFIAVYERQEIL